MLNDYRRTCNLHLEVIKCYCQRESTNSKATSFVCEKDGYQIKHVECSHGKICIGSSNIEEGISASRAFQMYRNDSLCVKGR